MADEWHAMQKGMHKPAPTFLAASFGAAPSAAAAALAGDCEWVAESDAAAGSEAAAEGPLLAGAAVAELELEGAGALLAFAALTSSDFGFSACAGDMSKLLHV